LPLGAFISFLQNHDQVGNRAFGERITAIADARAVRAAVEILLLAPSPPLLFMGEEFASNSPFLFFCDFGKDLAEAVTAGRRNEFARFAGFSDPSAREKIPDPNAAATFEASRLDWNSIPEPPHSEWLSLYRQLLRLRRQHIVPRLSAGCGITADYELQGDRGLTAKWKFADHSTLVLLANLGPSPLPVLSAPAAQIIHATDGVSADIVKQGTLPEWCVAWLLQS
jgi:maltooligosyltrehalose trehalohydrolase